MLTVSRQPHEIEREGIIRPPYFGIQFDQNGRSREALIALITKKLPGAHIESRPGARVLCVYLGEYADSEEQPWSTWSAKDFLEKLGEPWQLQAMISPDVVFPWALLLRVGRELNSNELRVLRHVLGITATKLTVADHCTAGIVYRLSMAVGNALPRECDIVALLETETQ